MQLWNEESIRPLAGIRKRGADDAEDRALAEELLADPKERAEHITIEIAQDQVSPPST